MLQDERPVSHRPKPARDLPSQTQQFLSLIPARLSPQITSLLLAELDKPFAELDEEGYIYIFCLTEQQQQQQQRVAADAVSVAEVASTILDSREQARGPGRRQPGTDDALRDLAVDNRRLDRKSAAADRSILLKIGRASNVHRRMTEWTRQCGYELLLLRFYPNFRDASPLPSPLPYPLPSPRTIINGASRRGISTDQRQPPPASPAPAPAPAPAPRKVKHVRRVERLIHIELSANNVKSACAVCGRTHREWFSIEPSRDGLRDVHDAVQRWIRWAENA